MTDQERQYLVETLVSRLSIANFGVSVEASGTETSQEVSCFSGDLPILIFVVEADSVTVVKTSTLFEEAKSYWFTTKLELFSIISTLLWGVFSSYISISSFFSVILGTPIRTWVSLLTRLCSGLDVELKRVSDGLCINDDVIKAKQSHAYFLGTINVDTVYDEPIDLCTAVMGFLNYILVNNSMDILNFELPPEDDENLVTDESEGSGDLGMDSVGEEAVDEPL